MKRPEGFDKRPPEPPAKPVKPARVTPISRRARAEKSKPERAGTEKVDHADAPRPSQVTPARESRAMVRRAARQRKAAERSEMRRFTRRTRSRRVVLIAAIATVALLAGSVTAAVFSPLLSLQRIEVSGTQRLDAAAIEEALSGQMGTPLALVSIDEISDRLGEFPLIRSFTTVSVPPDTLQVRIVEREAIAAVVQNGEFSIVDPAGIVIETSVERPVGFPLIEAAEASADDRGFNAAVEVLLALPADVLARVDSISATTTDDVVFTLAGGVQAVRWGSADRSEYKSRVLTGILATQDASLPLEFDVSAPDAVVVRPRS